MDDNTLKQLWLELCQTQKLEINTERLIESISQKVSNLEKMIRRRDQLEIFIAVLMMPIFGWWLITVPQVLAKIGAAIILTNCGLVIFRLIHARRINVKEDAASAIKYNLMVALQRVQKQIGLLNTVLWWYLMPFFIGIICFYYASVISVLSRVVYTIIVAALYGYIYYINKKVVKKKLKPMQDAIKKALSELSE